MLQEEKDLRSKLEGLNLKGAQVDAIVSDLLKDPLPTPSTDNSQLEHANNILYLEGQIQNETDPMKKARLIASKISYKIENYQY